MTDTFSATITLANRIAYETHLLENKLRAKLTRIIADAICILHLAEHPRYCPASRERDEHVKLPAMYEFNGMLDVRTAVTPNGKQVIIRVTSDLLAPFLPPSVYADGETYEVRTESTPYFTSVRLLQASHEPTTGLYCKDTKLLAETLDALRDNVTSSQIYTRHMISDVNSIELLSPEHCQIAYTHQREYWKLIAQKLAEMSSSTAEHDALFLLGSAFNARELAEFSERICKYLQAGIKSFLEDFCKNQYGSKDMAFSIPMQRLGLQSICVQREEGTGTLQHVMLTDSQYRIRRYYPTHLSVDETRVPLLVQYMQQAKSTKPTKQDSVA